MKCVGIWYMEAIRQLKQQNFVPKVKKVPWKVHILMIFLNRELFTFCGFPTKKSEVTRAWSFWSKPISSKIWILGSHLMRVWRTQEKNTCFIILKGFPGGLRWQSPDNLVTAHSCGSLKKNKRQTTIRPHNSVATAITVVSFLLDQFRENSNQKSHALYLWFLEFHIFRKKIISRKLVHQGQKWSYRSHSRTEN